MESMRMLYGLRVPDSTRLVEVRALAGNLSRSRVIYRGPLEEHGVEVTEDGICDQVAMDSKFWDWIGAQLRQRRIPADSSGDNGGVVRLKLSLSFIQQDGSKAIVDEASGATSIVTEDSWEFFKAAAGNQEQISQLALMERFFTLMMEQQKELPTQIAKILSVITETGRATLQTSAAESSKIIQASVEPLKAQMALIEKSHTHETTRADKSTDAVIRMMNSDDFKKPDSLVDNLVTLAGAAPQILLLLKRADELFLQRATKKETKD